MRKPQYFKRWIADWEWGVRIALFLILISSLFQFASFGLTQNYMVSFLGAQPEDISFALQMTYVGILSTLPVQFRFLRYFENRTYLLLNIIVGIAFSIVCLYVDDLLFFFIIRFLQGIVVCNIAACALMLIFSRLQSERMQVVGSSVFYGSILSSSVLIGLVAAMVVTTADWKSIYYYLIIFQIFALIICFLVFNRSSGHRRYPLYQIDWSGFAIFITGFSALCYTMIYGSKYYWFADQRIVYSSLIAVSAILLFIYRQLNLKRPLINPAVFKNRNFIIGLILLAFYYGAKDSINLIYNYTSAVLQWSTLDLMYLALCNMSGIVIFMTVSAQLIIYKRHSTRGFLLTGFGMLLLYQLWIYFIMTPDLAFTDLLFPLFFQGAATGLLFVPIIIFMLSAVPVSIGTTGTVIGASTRFIATLNSIAGFYNLQLYYNQYYKEGFLAHITDIDSNTRWRMQDLKTLYMAKGFSDPQSGLLANAAIARAIAQQSQLLTNKAIFMLLSVAVVIVMLLIIFVPHINKTRLHFNKRMFFLVRK